MRARAIEVVGRALRCSTVAVLASVTLVTAAGDLPAPVDESLRRRLGRRAIAFGSPVPARIWPVTALRIASFDGDVGPLADRRRQFPTLRRGQLLGLLALADDWCDARGEPLPAGSYTLRYGLQPRIKDHLGTSSHPDFLLVIPVARDDGEDVGQDAAVERSRRPSGTRHPAVLALTAATPAHDRLETEGTEGEVHTRVEIGSLALGVAMPRRCRVHGSP